MRTYCYHVYPPEDPEQVQRCREQLILAHRYGNRLVEIERARRAIADPILIPYRNARAKEYRKQQAAGAARPKVPQEPLFEADQAKLDEATAAAAASIREARKVCGLYWGTYLVVEDAAQRARRSPKKTRVHEDGTEELSLPRFKRFDGSGTLAVQLQKGLSAEELLAAKDPRAQLDCSGKHPVLRIRVGSNGRAPVWAEFSTFYHRPIPKEASIKWIRLVCRRIEAKYTWSAQFVIDAPEESFARPSPTKGVVALDVGWRRLWKAQDQRDGLRVATWVDEGNNQGELKIPEYLLGRYEKCESLRSIRDNNFNAVMPKLFAMKKGAAPWFIEATASAHLWKASARLAALVVRWRTSRWEGDEASFALMEAWRKQDKHLWTWEANQRQGVLRARRDIYQKFGCFLAQYRTVVVEKLDLRDFAELPEKDEPKEPRAIRAARPRRFFAALSELFSCAADAVGRAGGEWRELSAAHTTETCASCGAVEVFDQAVDLRHICQHCGAAWDQDVNAARNLLRAAKSDAPTFSRSRMKTPAPKGESAADLRRAKGLETRRKKRSKSGS